MLLCAISHRRKTATRTVSRCCAWHRGSRHGTDGLPHDCAASCMHVRIGRSLTPPNDLQRSSGPAHRMLLWCGGLLVAFLTHIGIEGGLGDTHHAPVLLPSHLRVGRALTIPVAVSDSTRGLSQLPPGGVETV